MQSLLDFIEDDTAGLVYSKEADDGRNDRENSQQLEIGRRKHEDIVVGNAMGAIVLGLFHFR